MEVVFLNFRYKLHRSFFFLIMTQNFSFSRSFGVIFFKNLSKLTSSHLVILKNILLQFSDLYNMTCVYSREEDKMYVWIETTPSYIQKKTLKLCFCVWTRMTWPQTSKSTFPCKISSHSSRKTAQLPKMLCNNVPPTVQRFEHNVLSPEFPGAASSLNLMEASLFFRVYLKCIELKSCIESASHYFHCFDGFKNVTMVMCQMGMWLSLVYTCCFSSLSTNHVGCPIVTLNFTIR